MYNITFVCDKQYLKVLYSLKILSTSTYKDNK